MAITEADESQLTSSWPHAEGRVLLAYSPDGRYLYTGGHDSYIRVHDNDTPFEEPAFIEYFKHPITSLHCSLDYLAACTEEGQTATFHHGQTELDALITRSDPGSAARCARFGFGGRKLAIASDELIVKVVDVRDTTEIQLLAGHTKSVLAVGWNPDGTKLVTASSDGTLRVWDLSSTDKEPTCIKTLEDVIPVLHPQSTLATCEPIWHPTGKYFVVPTKAHDIVMISAENWNQIGTFENGHHSARTLPLYSAILGSCTPPRHHCHQEVSQLAWSPNGNYLASAGSDQLVIVWDAASRSPLFSHKVTSGQVSNLAWQPGPGGNTLSIADDSGQVTKWDAVVPATKPHPSDGPPIGSRPPPQPQAPPPARVTHRREQSREARIGDATESVPGDDDEERAADLLAIADDDDGWIDDDMDGAYMDKPAASRAPKGLSTALGHQSGFSTAPKGTRTISGQAGQAPFQPGATPFKEKRRYLAFNHIGLIHAVDRDVQNMVTVEFHDRSLHRGYHFDDNFKFEYAALGERGALYACPARGDTQPSVVHYRPYQSWALSADWQFNLPTGESTVAVGLGGVPPLSLDDDLAPALGSGVAVVATDAGYLRIFSASGIQLQLIDLGQEIVSLVVGREWIFVVHRNSSIMTDGRQNLDYTIFDCDTLEVIQKGAIPLMKKQTLSWIGFSEDQMPAMYKSSGVLSLLHRSRRPGQARWVPVLDTNTLARREGKQESYWPVSVTSSQLHCVILKGEEKHPFFPTPLLQEFALQVPVLGLDGQQGVLEESFLRDSVISGHFKDGCAPEDEEGRTRVVQSTLEMDKTLLKLMQLACKADKLEQALEAARLLSQPQSLDAAAKLAGFFHQPGLQERILLVKEDKTGESAVDLERRESKWGHLVDNRTLVDSTRQARAYADGAGAGRVRPTATSILSKPVDVTSKRQSFGDATALKSKAPMMANHDSGHGSSEHDMEDANGSTMDFEDSQDETQPVAFSNDLPSSIPIPVPDPAARPKSLNPFAKTNNSKSKPPPPSSSNPFASKKTAGLAAPNEIKRSDSFFERVEGTAPPAASKGAAKQSTLFGIAPPAAEPEGQKKRGKKRKSDTEAAPATTTKTAQQAKLHFAKPSSAAPLPDLQVTPAESDLGHESETESGTPNKRTRVEEQGQEA